MNNNVTSQHPFSLTVDPENGNDSIGYRFGSPFQTLSAAKAAALEGDWIFVGKGTYNENDLAKHGVNWFFCGGASVVYTGSSYVGIFDDGGTYMGFTVDGQGSFGTTHPTTNGASVPWGVLNLTGGSSVKFRCDSIGSGTADTKMNVLNIVDVIDLEFECRQINAGTSTLFSVIRMVQGNCRFRCGKIFANSGNACYGFISEDSGLGYFSAFLESRIISIPSGCAILHNALLAASTLHVRCESIESFNTATCPTVVHNLTGTMYLTADRIKGLRSCCLGNNNGQMFATVKSLVCDVTAGIIVNGFPLFLWANGAADNTYLDCQSATGLGTSAGLGVSCSGVRAVIKGGDFKIPNGAGLSHGAGITEVFGARFDTTTTNAAANRPVTVSAAGLILRSCWLVNPALCLESVYAAAAQTIKCADVKAKVAKHANVTVQVEAILVDANVS
jgi:hypothetical protein